MQKKSVRFVDCFKTFTTDQDKAISPEETLDNFYSKIESLDMKILNEVRRIDNGRLDIPVYFSVCGEALVLCVPLSTPIVNAMRHDRDFYRKCRNRNTPGSFRYFCMPM